MGEKIALNGKHEYQLAPQKEEFKLYKSSPSDDTGRTCLEKCALSSCLLGFVFIVGGFISALLMKPYVQNKIEENLVLQPDGQVFLKWKEPPVTPI